MNKQKFVFEAPQKPEVEGVKKIALDMSEYDEPEKAEALIRNLNLSVKDTIREDGDNYFTINPKMVLEGREPGFYKRQVELVKKILIPQEIKAVSAYMRRKKADDKARDKVYYSITKRVEKLYKWNDQSKTHEPKKKKDAQVCELLDDLNNMEQYSSGLNNVIYNLLSKDDKDYIMCYRCAWDNKPIPNIQIWREKYDGEYRVLTDEEANQAAEDYFDDDYLWKQAVESGNTTESLEDWKKTVIQSDGRGSILNGYDGCEEFEEINGTTYYIYRHN